MTELPRDDIGSEDRKVRRVRARDAIRAGRLPCETPALIRGGRAQNTNCTVCLMPISPQALGFELEFGESEGSVATHVLHIPCFEAWEAECQTENDRTRAPNGAHNGHGNGSGRPTGEGSR